MALFGQNSKEFHKELLDTEDEVLNKLDSEFGSLNFRTKGDKLVRVTKVKRKITRTKLVR